MWPDVGFSHKVVNSLISYKRFSFHSCVHEMKRKVKMKMVNAIRIVFSGCCSGVTNTSSYCAGAFKGIIEESRMKSTYLIPVERFPS